MAMFELARRDGEAWPPVRIVIARSVYELEAALGGDAERYSIRPCTRRQAAGRPVAVVRRERLVKEEDVK